DSIVGTRYGKIAEVKVIDNSGEEISSFRIKGVYSPYALAAIELNGDRNSELIVGTLRYTVNSIAGAMEEAYSKPAEVFAMDISGNTIWSDAFDAAVTSISLCDLDGDKNPEIIVGTTGSVSAYSRQGTKNWITDVSGQVNALACGDIDSDGTNEIAVAAGKAYVLDKDGKTKWSYSASDSYSIKMSDIGQDGQMEVLLGSNALRIFDSSGNLLYKSDSHNKVMSIDVGDLNGDGFEDIVYGSTDHIVRALGSKAYSQEIKAAKYFQQAEDAYNSGNLNQTKYFATLSKETYQLIGRDNQVVKANELANRAQNFMDGRTYYDISKTYSAQSKYDDAAAYADKALEAFRRVNDLKMLTEVTEFKNRALMIPQAAQYMNQSIASLEKRDYVNATIYSQKAKSAYGFLGDAEKEEEAGKILAKANMYLDFYKELDLAYWNSTYLDFGNATVCLDKAVETYNQLNDTHLEKQLKNITSLLEEKQRKDNTPLIIGGIILVVILLLLFVLIILAYYYLKNRGGTQKTEYYHPSNQLHRRKGGGLGDSSGLGFRH
ncbi:MAG: VCBS repeat-containing protein, partial [Candidatus Altiarchaeota archaeon]|nr:VCBS repeat-containing protein [Candidatus Altiarchaeota archaeon]